MKRYWFATIATLIPLSLATSTQAQVSRVAVEALEPTTEILAGFGIGGFGGRVEVDVGDEDDSASPESGEDQGQENSGSAAGGDGFSGDTVSYADDFNGFSVTVPVEYELESPGQTTNWIGPILDGGAVGIYVNAAPLPGVDPYMLQQVNKQQYEQDSFYTDVVETTVPYGSGEVLALRVKEGNNLRGTNTEKGPDEIHRWHLLVFGNDRVYTWGFTGMYKTFDDNDVQALYEDVIESVQLIPIDQG
jgi:hypothetical protein